VSALRARTPRALTSTTKRIHDVEVSWSLERASDRYCDPERLLRGFLVRRSSLLITASATLAGAMLLLGAGPASAAELPPGSTLYVIGENAVYTSTSDGSLTLLGNLPDLNNVYGADWDATTGVAYFFTSGLACDLYRLDVTTGAATFVAELEFDNCDALDVAADGTLRIADDSGTISTVDKTDGTTISDITVDPQVGWISQAPSGAFYIGDYSGFLYTLDPNTGDTVQIAHPTGYIESADFDTDGTLWMSVELAFCQGLASLSLADPEESFTPQGEFGEDKNTCVQGYALFVVPGDPAPALPATGPDNVIAPLALAGLVLVLGLVAYLRSRKTASA
jgi:LPXTG-motif cell wall-anchored protein